MYLPIGNVAAVVGLVFIPESKPVVMASGGGVTGPGGRPQLLPGVGCWSLRMPSILAIALVSGKASEQQVFLKSSMSIEKTIAPPNPSRWM